MENTPEKASRSYRAADEFIQAIAYANGRSITASGLNNLPSEGAYTLAYTHHNSWDVPALGHAVYEQTARPIYFMAKQELIDLPIIGSLLKSMHGIPIDRESPGPRQVIDAVEVLKNGHILGMAAEGGRINGDKVQAIKGGVGFITCKASAVAIPVGIAGHNRFNPFLSRDLHLHFGKAIIPEGSTRKDGEEMDKHLLPALQGVLNEAYEKYAEVYGQKAASKLDFY